MTWRFLGLTLVLGAATAVSTGCAGMNMRPFPLAAKQSETDPIAAKVSFARLCERHGQTEQARQTYQSLLKQHPKMQTPLHRLAVMAARQGKFDEADQYFDKALAAAPPTAELLSDRGYAFYLEDRLEEAEQSLRDATTLDPQYKAAKVNLGLVLGQLDRVNESYAAFKDAVGEAQAYANLAYVHAQRNDFQQAEVLYSRALSTNPEMRSAALALVQLHDLKKRQESESGVTQAKANEPISARKPKAAATEEDLVESPSAEPAADVPMQPIAQQAEPRPAVEAVAVEIDKTPAQELPSQVSTVTTNKAVNSKPMDRVASAMNETASRSFVPRQRATEIGQEWRTGETPQQRVANNPMTEPTRQVSPSPLPMTPTKAQGRTTVVASKPTDNTPVEMTETASRSFVPRQRATEIGQEWRTGEAAPQHSAVNSTAAIPRQVQAGSDLAHEEIQAKAAAAASPIQVTTRQAEKRTTDNATRMTVTKSPQATQVGPQPAALPAAAQTSSTGFNPQVVDMTQVRSQAPTPVRPSDNEAPISISLQKKSQASENIENRPIAASATSELPLPRSFSKQNKVPLSSPMAPKTPAAQSVSQRFSDAEGETSGTPKNATPLKTMVVDQGKLPAQPRTPQAPPAPPVPPSRKPSTTTESLPVSTRTSPTTISDRPTAGKFPTSTKAIGAKSAMILDKSGVSVPSSDSSSANAPARLDPVTRTPMQRPGQVPSKNTPTRYKSFDEKPVKAVNAADDGLMPPTVGMPSQNSAVRYVDYRDLSPTVENAPGQVQPAFAGDAPEVTPSAPTGMPSSYPSTSNPGAATSNGSSFQGAKILTPTAPSAAMSQRQGSTKLPTKTDSFPGYAGASDGR
jgi:Tfp pilus assembly protein PilF